MSPTLRQTPLRPRKRASRYIDETIAGMRTRAKIKCSKPLSVHDDREVVGERTSDQQVRDKRILRSVNKGDGEIDGNGECLWAKQASGIAGPAKRSTEVTSEKSDCDRQTMLGSGGANDALQFCVARGNRRPRRQRCGFSVIAVFLDRHYESSLCSKATRPRPETATIPR